MKRPLLVSGLLAFAVLATAQTFPPYPKTGTVFDGANLLTPQQERTISNLARDFKRDTGAPIAVATITSLKRYEAQSLGIQRYSTALFNQWRVGRKEANGGILLVVAKEDRKVWVALGRDWGRHYDAKTTGIVRGTITPLFKQGKFGEGIVKGCYALVRLADNPTPPPSVSVQAAPAQTMPMQAGEMPIESYGPVGMPVSTFSHDDEGFSSIFGFLGGGLGCLCPVLAVVFFIAALTRSTGRARRRPYGGGYAAGPMDAHRYDDPRDDSGAFLTGMMVGQAMSQPTYDPTPFDSGPDWNNSDSGGSDWGSSDSGSSDSSSSDSGSFDSGSSDGGGGGGDW